MCKGVTLACIHTAGNVPLVIQLLISLASDGATAGAAIFNKRVLTPSRPAALPDGIAFINWWVWLGVIEGKATIGDKIVETLYSNMVTSET